MMNFHLNHDPSTLRAGDKVRTEFNPDEKHVIRKVIYIEHDIRMGSGWAIRADDGGECACCHRPLGKPIGPVDGAWFLPAEETE